MASLSSAVSGITTCLAQLENALQGRLVSLPRCRAAGRIGKPPSTSTASRRAWGEELALRVYTSRLIGRDPDLVMHGGGNTSLKGTVTTLVGDEVEALFVKGSGWDLDAIEPPGLPAVDLAHLRRLRALAALSDEEMVNQLRTHLFDAGAPNPSVETLLHAFLPAPLHRPHPRRHRARRSPTSRATRARRWCARPSARAGRSCPTSCRASRSPSSPPRSSSATRRSRASCC